MLHHDEYVALVLIITRQNNIDQARSKNIIWQNTHLTYYLYFRHNFLELKSVLVDVLNELDRDRLAGVSLNSFDDLAVAARAKQSFQLIVF